MKDKQIIKKEEVGSMEEIFGENDPIFQPEPEDNIKDQAHLDSIKQEPKNGIY